MLLKQIAEFPDYEVSDTGKVFRRSSNRELKRHKTTNSVRLYRKEMGYSRSVAKLVFETFVGTLPEGFVLEHKDKDPSNNSLHNLKPVLRYKIDDHQLCLIKSMRKRGDTLRQIGKALDVSPQTARYHLNKKKVS